MERVTITFTLNEDSRGYTSRACGACRERFKIKGRDDGSPHVTHCPFCARADEDWHTPEQHDFIKALAMEKAAGPALDDLEEALRGLERAGGGLVKVTRTGNLGRNKNPKPPPERDDDMPVETTFSCCGETMRHNEAPLPKVCFVCATPLAQAHPV